MQYKRWVRMLVFVTGQEQPRAWDELPPTFTPGSTPGRASCALGAAWARPATGDRPASAAMTKSSPSFTRKSSAAAQQAAARRQR